MRGSKSKIDAGGRECSRCGQYKLWKDFYAHNTGARGYTSACRTCFLEAQQARLQQPGNKKKIQQYHREYRKRPGVKQRMLAANKRSQQKRRQSLAVRLNHSLSVAIHRSICGYDAGRHWQDLVGYTLAGLRRHLEFFFEPGMTWENYGEWHMDHVEPKSSFRFKTSKNRAFRKCWALSNLVPRWKTTAIARRYGSTQIGNIEKKDKSPWELQATLPLH